MASRSSIIYTARDQQIHELLALTPLDTRQLLKASQTFAQPFTTDRKLRERMQEHTEAGWIHTYTYATPTAGQLNYYRLSQDGPVCCTVAMHRCRSDRPFAKFRRRSNGTRGISPT